MNNIWIGYELGHFIDTHVHGFPPRLFDAIWKYFESNYWAIYEKKYTPDILTQLQLYGAKKISLLLYAHKPGIAKELNDWMHDIALNNPIIFPFGTIHAQDSNITEEVSRVLSPDGLNFQGLKIQLMVTDFDPNISALDPMYEALIKYQKVLIMHAGTGPVPEYLLNKQLQLSPHVGIKKLIPVLERFPKLKLQVPHLGCMECDYFFNLAADFPNLMFDTAMALDLIFENSREKYYSKDYFLQKFIDLQDRIMFGSDYPNIPYAYNHCIESLDYLKLDDKIKEKIFLKNAEMFYG